MMLSFHSERGSAMMIALALLLMMGLIGTAAVQTSTTDMGIAENYQHDRKSFYIADAGAEHAFAKIRTDYTWRAGFQGQNFAGGTYDVTLIDKTTQPALKDTVIVTSTGTRSGAKTAIEVKLAKGKPFKWSAFAKDSMKLCGNTYTNSYNSDSGTYAATKMETGGDVGSNGYVDICGSADINGDASSSTPGALDIIGNASVSGDTTTVAPIVFLDPVPQSEIDWAKANSSAPAGLAGTYTYNNGTKDISVKPGKTLTLSSGTYYFKDFDINGNVVLAPGASVKIYIVGDVKIQAQAAINVAGKPIDFQIFGAGTSFTVAGGAEIRSALYAPTMSINLQGGANFYGAYVGNVDANAGGASFHYDRSLGDLELPNRLAKISWREL